MLGGGSWSLLEDYRASLFIAMSLIAVLTHCYSCESIWKAAVPPKLTFLNWLVAHERVNKEGQVVVFLCIGASCVSFKERTQWHQIYGRDCLGRLL